MCVVIFYSAHSFVSVIVKMIFPHRIAMKNMIPYKERLGWLIAQRDMIGVLAVAVGGSLMLGDWRVGAALLLLAGAYAWRCVRDAETLAAIQREREALISQQAELQAQIVRHEQMANALHQSESRFHSVITHHIDAILVVDFAHVIRFANPAAQALFELAADQLVGKKFAIPVIEGESVEFELPKRTGSTSIVEIRAVEIVWDNEPAYLESLRDITEYREAVEALRDSQDQLRMSYQREQQRRQLSDTLREVAKIVSSTLDQDTVIRIVFSQLESVLAYDCVTVMLLTDQHELVLAARRDVLREEEGDADIAAQMLPLNSAILQAKQPICIPEVASDPTWRNSLLPHGVHSFIGMPLLVQETPIGILTVARRDGAAYTDDDARTVFSFAAQVAIAIYNAKLHADTEERSRRLALLHDISLAVNSTLELSTLLTAACQKFVENFEADHSGIVLFEPDAAHAEVKAEYPSQHAVGLRIPLEGYTLMQDMLVTLTPQEVYDAQHDARMEKVREVMCLLGIRSILIVPLISQGQVIGSFSLDSMARQRHFTPAEIALAQTIATQLAMAIENARLLAQERTRLEEELETARQIQISLFPSTSPNIPGLDIAGVSYPAKKVGGDFYNYFAFDQTHFGIAVGDVSGKGLQAALMMALSFGLISIEARRENTPSMLLSKLNADLRPHTQRNKKNTAICYLAGEFLCDGHENLWTIHVANAGMIAPLMRRRDGSVAWIEVSGLPLGMVSGMKYVEREERLRQGDLLILSSDGLVEAMNVEGELYGFERFEAALASAPADSARAVQEYLLADIRRFLGEIELHDDLTIVVLLATSDSL